jgi:hypothetical protein
MRFGRVSVVGGLPLLLVGVVVVLGPLVDHFTLGLIVLVVALATACLGDWMRSFSRRRSAHRRSPVIRNSRLDGSASPPSLDDDHGPEAR